MTQIALALLIITTPTTLHAGPIKDKLKDLCRRHLIDDDHTQYDEIKIEWLIYWYGQTGDELMREILLKRRAEWPK